MYRIEELRGGGRGGRGRARIPGIGKELEGEEEGGVGRGGVAGGGWSVYARAAGVSLGAR